MCHGIDFWNNLIHRIISYNWKDRAKDLLLHHRILEGHRVEDSRFNANLGEFDKRDVAVVGCSTDSEFSHWAWVNTPRSQGGIQGVTYPIVSDINKTISADYGVLAGDEEIDEDGNVEVNGELIAYRGLFLIDKDGIVRHQLINDFPLGRSIDEAIRVVDDLQHFELYGEVCPLGWHKGDAAMTPSHEGVASYLSK